MKEGYEHRSWTLEKRSVLLCHRQFYKVGIPVTNLRTSPYKYAVFTWVKLKILWQDSMKVNGKSLTCGKLLNWSGNSAIYQKRKLVNWQKKIQLVTYYTETKMPSISQFLNTSPEEHLSFYVSLHFCFSSSTLDFSGHSKHLLSHEQTAEYQQRIQHWTNTGV